MGVVFFINIAELDPCNDLKVWKCLRSLLIILGVKSRYSNGDASFTEKPIIGLKLN